MEENRKPGNPGSMREAAKRMREREATPEEAAALEGADWEPDESDADETPQVYPGELRKPQDVGMPKWVMVPKDLPIPPEGTTMTAMRFEPEWTDRPQLGQRQCILWNLSYGDEKFSRRRARGDADAVMDEQAKQMIRAIDGRVVDWGRDDLPNSPNRFWDEIGKKCRLLIQNHYMQVHSLGQKEKVHFLANCLAVRTVAPSPRPEATRRARGRSTPTG